MTLPLLSQSRGSVTQDLGQGPHPGTLTVLTLPFLQLFLHRIPNFRTSFTTVHAAKEQMIIVREPMPNGCNRREPDSFRIKPFRFC